MHTYREAVQAVLAGGSHPSLRWRHVHSKRTSSKLYRVLSALRAGNTSTSRELSDRLAALNDPIATRNVNWVLSKVPDLATRFESDGEQIHYRITSQGLEYLNYIDARASSESETEQTTE